MTAPIKNILDHFRLDSGVLSYERYGSGHINETYLITTQNAAHYILQKVEVDKEISFRVKNIVKSICDSALDSETDVGEILRRSGYADDYVRACFKRETGKMPLAFLTEIRIKHACYLIDVYKDSLSLSEIAEACGYTDYVYFSKRFKQYTGMSPRAYRDS